MTMDYRSAVENDFHRARHKQIFSRMLALLRNEKDDLLSFHDIKSILKPQSETYRGMKTVKIETIVGSEGRYADFNRGFLPRRTHLKSRWTNVGMAHRKDIILPPIKLYEIGGIYFVRDGNHRVSVARTYGGEFIDAEVVSLSSKIPLSPGMTEKQMKRTVIDFEKKRFYETTHLNELKPECKLDFTAPGRYDDIICHIQCHINHIKNKSGNDDITFEEGMLSWYKDVYLPIITIIKEERLLSRFTGRTPADLYVWIVRHWDDLNCKYDPEFPLREAIIDFAYQYGKNPLSRAIDYVTGLFRGKKDRG